MTLPYLTPRPLTDGHDLTAFECASAEQAAWLRRYALQSHRSDSTRVFVVTQRSSAVVVAYYAIRMADIAFADATDRRALGRGRHPQPVVLVARLGVDLGHEGRGLGSELLRHAFIKALEASSEIGCRAVAVHCESEEARRFYLRVVPAFESSPTDPLHLIVLIKDLRHSCARSYRSRTARRSSKVS